MKYFVRYYIYDLNGRRMIAEDKYRWKWLAKFTAFAGNCAPIGRYPYFIVARYHEREEG